MSHADVTYTENVRRVELELIADELKTTDHVLEIGGGSGYQAAAISGYVENCVSIDVALHPEPRFPVLLYDGVTIPFGDSTFDVIFSSNVLEHVKNLDALLDECARVLKPGGAMYHIVPSPLWRVWTSLTYYPALPKVVLGNLRNLQSADASLNEPLTPGQKRPTPKSTNSDGGRATSRTALSVLKRFKLKWIRSILLSPRHVERGNEFTEAFYFRAAWWRTLFERNGWKVAEEQPGRLYYSGNILFGALIGMQSRRGLSRVLGSATRKFKVVRPGD